MYPGKNPKWKIYHHLHHFFLKFEGKDRRKNKTLGSVILKQSYSNGHTGSGVIDINSGTIY